MSITDSSGILACINEFVKALFPDASFLSFFFFHSIRTFVQNPYESLILSVDHSLFG